MLRSGIGIGIHFLKVSYSLTQKSVRSKISQMKKQVEVLTSTLNYVDSRSLAPIFWTPENCKRVIDASGYDGIEHHPNAMLSGLLLQLGLASDQAKSKVRALHQTWTSKPTPTSISNLLHSPIYKMMLEVFSQTFLPEMNSSLDDMARIQHVVGRRLPAVLFPSHESNPSIDEKRRAFSERTFQPTAEWLGTYDGSFFAYRLLEFRQVHPYFTGVCLDLGHIKPMGNWQDLLPILLHDAQEIHIRCAEDFGREEEVKKDLRSLLTGIDKSDILTQLDYIKRHGQKVRRVITELSASTLASQIRPSGVFVTQRELVQAHQAIVQTIRGALGISK